MMATDLRPFGESRRLPRHLPSIIKTRSESGSSFAPRTTTSLGKESPSGSSNCSSKSMSGPLTNRNAVATQPELANTPVAESTRSIRDNILATIHNLRAFAMSLSGNIDNADDLVQETLVRALAHMNSFEPGTNFRPGYLRSCAIYFDPSTASVNAKWKTATAASPQRLKLVQNRIAELSSRSFNTRFQRSRDTSAKH